MPYDDPFAADDGLPDFDPRQATKAMQLQRMKQEVQDNPWALGSSAGPPGGPPRAFLSNPAPRPQDPLTPAYEGASPAVGGYGMGQAIGETIKAPTLREKAQAAFPLVAGMAIPGAPKGARVGRRHDALFDFSERAPDFGRAAEGGTELTYAKSHDPNERYVSTVWTDPAQRRQGQSRALMQKLTEHADAEGKSLRLMAGDEEGIGFDNIRKFYGSLGFKEVGGVIPGVGTVPPHVEMARPNASGRQPTAAGKPPLDVLSRLYFGDKPFSDLKPEQLNLLRAYQDRLGQRVGRGVKVRPEIPRELDPMGFYSQALEAAKAWPQPKGTPEQVLAALKQAGVKDAEIAATNLQGLLAGKSQVTREELVSHLRDNRVQLQEGKYGTVTKGLGSPISEDPRALLARTDEMLAEKPGDRHLTAYRRDLLAQIAAVDAGETLTGPAKWSQYSLDPSNPTYRETVIHLPERGEGFEKIDDRINRLINEQDDVVNTFGGDVENATTPAQLAEHDRLRQEIERLVEQRTQNLATTFRQGHFSEPNVIAHARTSIQKDASGKPVFLVDELQSDWGQKLRDGGIQDPQKVAELRKRHDEATAVYREAQAEGDRYVAAHGHTIEGVLPRPAGHYDTTSLLNTLYTDGPDRTLSTQAFGLSNKINNAANARRLLEAELRTAEAATPGHPLVNTTDQWVTTAQRRLLQQAVEAKAEGIAITPGQLQNERYPSLETMLSHIRVTPSPDGTRTLQLRRQDAQGRRTNSDINDVLYVDGEGKIQARNRYNNLEGAHVNEAFGRDVGDRIMNGQPHPGSNSGEFTIEGDGLRAGGHGMRYAYDQMYPKALEKQLRKLDPEYPGRGQTALLNDPDRKAHWREWPNAPTDRATPRMHYDQEGNATPFHYFPITERVREAVAKGLPLFSSAALMALIPQAQQPKPELDERAPFGYDQ